ncbi:extracellular signal-regulated kinase 2 isoform X2 [Onthophagus taurus]|uniref:extracellular signal-regulated kinase 2 isoform X2 n=1 Tax=Onthophagus taurus TaxID=166361 RepID=UPI000C2032C6|nr:mitogen-activated protein kinase 15 [Onthophagus taurus]
MSEKKDKMSEIDEHIMKRFDIQKRLGKGAYGIVWKAVDKKTKEVLAVKKIFDAFRNQTDAQRTYREIMFLQCFKNHPNVIRLHSIHRAANNRDIYLGFEYMETDLHNVIKRGNILKDVHKRYIMYQLLKATKYIHSGNVIHRDQKPSNVLLDTLCRCKIADFGLARSLTQLSDSSETDPTLTDYVATRWYRAPEILIANRKYTKGIDMWSLGCILGEMVAGKPLFPGSSTVNQVEKIMSTIVIPTQEDIATICVSGVGSSMIKNACNLPRVSMKSIVGEDVASDAIDLINQLLVFNPMKRLTAEQALEHLYVRKFHDESEEIEMSRSVIIPLNDDVRLSVDDYRNKLYELMQTHNITKHHRGGLHKTTLRLHTESVKPTREVKSKVCKDAERYLKSRSQKEKPYNTQSEPRLGHLQNYRTSLNIKSDSKIPKPMVATTTYCGDYNKQSSDCSRKSAVSNDSKERIRRRSINSRSNVYMSFNSYNQNHGIITQSALTELKAAGMR